MSKRTTILDDLDQTEGAETRTFSIGPKVYQIDLTDPNFEKLEKAVARFIKAATDISPIPRRPSMDAYTDVDQGLVRKWAIAEGLEVSSKGRVPLDIVYRWKRAQEAPVEPDDSEEPDEPAQPVLQVV